MKALRLLFLNVIFLFISSCLLSQKTFKNIDTWLPPDYDPKAGVLLVDNNIKPKSQVEKMEKYMSENYHYGYQFVDISVIETEDAKFSDLSKYRFVLVCTYGAHTMKEMYPEKEQMKIGSFDFFFYDRQKKKAYPATKKGSSLASMTFNAMINTIIEKFEG